MRGRVPWHNLFVGRGDLKSLFQGSSNVEAIRRSASMYTSYASLQTAFRSSRGIFYSVKHIFAAEHVLAFRKRSTCMRIPESLIPGKLAKRILAASWMNEDMRSVVFLPGNWFRNILVEEKREGEMWKTCCLNIYLSAKMQFFLHLWNMYQGDRDFSTI